MPTYEFTCPNGHDFEKFFRTISSGESELPCPTCGAIATRKISAGAGLMFKGSGFYITDYGKDGKKDQNLPRKSANGESGASSSSDSGTGSGDSKSSGDAKSSADAKSSGGDSKSGDSKSASSDSKASSSDSKPAAAKPAESKPSAPKSSSSSE
jgi:putative FmdB family regulatory protein